MGGDGGFGESGNNGGGGGGGGYYGGGGGGPGCSAGGGGGGGGSSLVPAGGTLELADPLAQPEVAITYTLPPASPGNPLSGSPPVVSPPNTVLGLHPPKKVKTAKTKAKVKFAFSANLTGTSFECKLDKAAYAPCNSPKRYRVKLGKHKFSVRAVKGGAVDPTPASFRFKVVKST